MPAPPSLVDAASRLGLRPVQLAQAIREGNGGAGAGGEVLVGHGKIEELTPEGRGVG